MADAKSEEPSIEEILESIRQIISEDGEPQPAVAVTPPAKPAAPAPAPVPAPAQDNILNLTEKVGQKPQPAMELELQDTPAPAEESMPAETPLISDTTADAAAHALARLLSGNLSVERELPGRPGNVTLEDMTREILKPIIKTWLDQNLPRIIETMVAREIERVSKLAMKQ